MLRKQLKQSLEAGRYLRSVGGGVVMNDNVISSLHISDEQVREVIDSETAELTRRERAYRSGRPLADPEGKIVILVDDGIATGATIRAALRATRTRDPQRLVLAVPVAPPEAIASLRTEADEIVCLEEHELFAAVGLYYADFRQVSDREVVEILTKCAVTSDVR